MMLLLGFIAIPLHGHAATTMSNEQAAALLDYHMDNRVERAMRQRLQADANDGNAWHFLALALRAQGKADEADKSQARADKLGTGERQWHADIRLSGFSDSNVVVAPDALHLGARDRGDIGARINILLTGQALQRGRMHTAWSLAYGDMLYQDFRAYALRQTQAAVTEHVDIGESASAYLGAHGEMAWLGGARLLNGWNAVGGLGMSGDTHSLNLDLSYGHRGFQSGYDAFTAWRWKAVPSWTWQDDGYKTGLSADIAREQTRNYAEAYRQTGGSAMAAWRALDGIGRGAVWLQASGGYELRNYAQTNTQPYLVRATKRRDTQTKLVGEIAWKRKTSLFGDSLAEIWKWQAGWMRNRSNISTGTVFDPAQSRSWKRWWSEVSVQWHY